MRMKLGAFLKGLLFRRCDSALLGAFLFVVGSVVSKFSSFALNIYLAKKIDPELFGIGFVSIALITNLSQSLNKRCFRRVALSETADPREKEGHSPASIQSSINVCWLSILSTAAISSVMTMMWLANPPSNIVSDARLTKQFRVSVLLAGVSSVLESASEPFVLNLIRKEQVFVRSAIEMLSGTSKSLVIVLVVLLRGSSGLDILYYSIGQLTYSSVLLAATMLACLVTAGGPKDLAVLPRAASEAPASPQFLTEAHQSLLKQQLLTSVQSAAMQETDKILVLRLFSAKDWSNYGVISNLANIVTRVIFAPIEEIATERFREVKLDPPQSRSVKRLRAQLTPLRELLFLSAAIGALAVLFGPPVSKNLLSIVFGANWVTPENVQLLSANICTLGILAVHGILETFMLSLGGISRISAYRRFCMAIHCMHVALILLLRHGGCMALLLSNGAAMLSQVLYCSLFVFTTIRPALSGQELRGRLRSASEILAEKGSGRILLYLTLGGLAQRYLLRLAQARPTAGEGLRNDLGRLAISAAAAICSLLLSLPSLCKTLGKFHTDKNK